MAKEIALKKFLILALFSASILFGEGRAESADSRYGELFDSKNSELLEIKDSNPEYYEILKNFIYGEAVEIGNLTKRERSLILIVVLSAKGEYELLEKQIDSALRVGVSPIQISEAIYQTTPYAGVGNGVKSIKIANSVFKKRGIKLPLKSQKRVDEENRYQKGLEVQVELFGEGMRKHKANSINGEEHISHFLSDYCFGDFYTRDGLDLKFRELLTLCMLIALGDTRPQIISHINANLKMGNDRDVITWAITQAMPYIGFPRTLNALNALNETVKK